MKKLSCRSTRTVLADALTSPGATPQSRGDGKNPASPYLTPTLSASAAGYGRLETKQRHRTALSHWTFAFLTPSSFGWQYRAKQQNTRRSVLKILA